MSLNTADIVIILILAALVAWIIRSLIRDRKRGKCSCGGSCGACPMSDCCHKK